MGARIAMFLPHHAGERGKYTAFKVFERRCACAARPPSRLCNLGWTLAGKRMRGGSPCAPRKRPKIGAVHLRSRYSTANRDSSPDLKSFSAKRRTRSRDGELARQQNAARRSWEGRE